MLGWQTVLAYKVSKKFNSADNLTRQRAISSVFAEAATWFQLPTIFKQMDVPEFS